MSLYIEFAVYSNFGVKGIVGPSRQGRGMVMKYSEGCTLVLWKHQKPVCVLDSVKHLLGITQAPARLATRTKTTYNLV